MRIGAERLEDRLKTCLADSQAHGVTQACTAVLQIIRSSGELSACFACCDAHHKWRVSCSLQIRQERG